MMINRWEIIAALIIMKFCHHLLQSQVYLVAGGLNGPRMRGSLSSTELLVEGDTKWKVVRQRKTNIEELVLYDDLSLRRVEWRLGCQDWEGRHWITLSTCLVRLFSLLSKLSHNTIIFSGGQDSSYTTINNIWRFNARNQSWVDEGTMQNGRFYHAVSVVRVKDFCPDANWL